MTGDGFRMKGMPALKGIAALIGKITFFRVSLPR